MSRKNELRHLVVRHLHRPELPFSISETEPGSYDVIFPGNKLPPMDYDGLLVALDAKVRFRTTADESHFDSAVFAGHFKGEPVLLFLRAAAPIA